MYYYDPDNKSPRRWAMIATAVYGVLLAGSFALVSFDFSPVTDKPGDTILVDFTEPPVPEPPRPPVKVANEPRVHDVAAPVEPADSGVIRIIYEPHKSEPGAFNKVIQVYSNSVDGRDVITVQGNSIEGQPRGKVKTEKVKVKYK